MATRDLIIKLIGDPSSALAAMKEAEGGASKLAKVGLAVGAGMAAVGAGALAFGADSVKAFDNVAGATKKLQMLTGGTAEDMSRLAFEAHETGVSQETLEKSLTKASKAIMSQQTADGKAFDAMVRKNGAYKDQITKLEALKHPTDSQIAQLAELRDKSAALTTTMQSSALGTEAFGVSIMDANGNMRPMNDILGDAAEMFKNMPNGIEKNALAMKMFGKSGTDMIPMLNKGREGLAELSKESDKFGLTIGQKDVDAYKKNVIAGREMHAALEGLKVQIGERLMPVISMITSWLSAHLPAAMEFVKAALTRLQPAFDFLGVVAQEAFRLISEGVKWLDEHKAVLAVVAGVIAGLLVGAFIAWATAAAAAAVATLTAMSPVILIGAAIGALAAGVIYAYQHFTWFRETVQSVASVFMDYVWPAIKKIWNILVDLVKIAILPLKIEFNLLKDVIVGAWHLISDNWGTAVAVFGAIWDGLKEGFAKVEHFITAPFKAAFNFVADMWNKTLGGFGFTVPSWIPGIGGDSFKFPMMPHLASGGTMLQGGLALVGEKGPEVVSLPQGATVHPNGTMPANGATFIFNGVTDHHELARKSAREFGWMLRATG